MTASPDRVISAPSSQVNTDIVLSTLFMFFRLLRIRDTFRSSDQNALCANPAAARTPRSPLRSAPPCCPPSAHRTPPCPPPTASSRYPMQNARNESSPKPEFLSQRPFDKAQGLSFAEGAPSRSTGSRSRAPAPCAPCLRECPFPVHWFKFGHHGVETLTRRKRLPVNGAASVTVTGRRPVPVSEIVQPEPFFGTVTAPPTLSAMSSHAERFDEAWTV